MKKTLGILIAATALTAILGIPAWSAMGAAPLRAAMIHSGETASPLVLVDEDEGEDDDGGMLKLRRSGEHDEDAAGEDDDEDAGNCQASQRACGAGNPAPAGTAPPPANGLFGNGAAPKAQVN